MVPVIIKIMSMKKILTLILTAFSIAPIFAEAISPHDALQNFKLCSPKHLTGQTSGVKLIFTGEDNGNPSYYVFSNNDKDGGYIILSAQDKSNSLIGYSRSGVFDEKIIPEALSTFARAHDKRYAPVPLPGKKAIAPLLSTSWNQIVPYNYTLPRIGENLSKVGCVGVAMAQVLKYHEYPIKPQGIVDYYTYGELYGPVSDDLSKYSFNYSLMIDNYENGTPDESSIKAVNDLCYCCGMSVEADWGYNVTTAKSEVIPEAMINHFGYDPTIGLVHRKYYDSLAWQTLIYSQLEQGLPVIISANTTDQPIGHAFVCDGYDGEGYYHINWGWGGQLDGFFNLNALYAYSPDTDYSTEGWGKNVCAIVNMCPPGSDIKPAREYVSGQFKLPYRSFRKIIVPCEVVREVGPIENIKLGLRFENLTTGENFLVYSNNVYNTDYFPIAWEYDVMLPDDFEVGTYKAYPIVYFVDSGNWNEIKVNPQSTQYVIAEIKDDEYTFFNSEGEFNLSLENESYPDVLFHGKKYCASTEIVNNGDADFAGEVALCVYTFREDGNILIRNNPQWLVMHIPTGERRSALLAGEFQGYKGENLYIGFMRKNNYDYIPLGEPAKITVEDYVQGELVIDDIEIEKYPTVDNPTLTLKTTLHCENGYYADEIYTELVDCDEYGNIIESDDEEENSEENLVMFLPAYDYTAGFDNTNSKIPKHPPYIISRHPGHISGNHQSEGEVIKGGHNSDEKRPEKHKEPVYYYRDSNNDWVLLIGGLIISFIYWNHDSDVPSDAPQLISNEFTDSQFYNLDGVPQNDPLTPGIYIKKNGIPKEVQKIVVK